MAADLLQAGLNRLGQGATSLITGKPVPGSDAETRQKIESELLNQQLADLQKKKEGETPEAYLRRLRSMGELMTRQAEQLGELRLKQAGGTSDLDVRRQLEGIVAERERGQTQNQLDLIGGKVGAQRAIYGDIAEQERWLAGGSDMERFDKSLQFSRDIHAQNLAEQSRLNDRAHSRGMIDLLVRGLGAAALAAFA